LKKTNKKGLILPVALLLGFAVWTVLISTVDTEPIGPGGSMVGFSALNGFVFRLTGVNWGLYYITDLLSIVLLFVAFCFGLLGLYQMIKRKSILKVDYSILVLGGLYIITVALYLFFDTVIVNHRPTLIDGVLEASYPSSTTLLVLSIMPTALMQFKTRIKNIFLKRFTVVLTLIFTVFMVVGRFISGVHWFSDIVVGVLLGTGLVCLYRYILALSKRK